MPPVIPEFITVHLGAPDSNAQNVTVTFPDYIKNVASGEIYPTWNESALRANIYAQISFALNRVYLEFYRSRGYDFDITSSTSIDQSYAQGRNIFQNISEIVDDIFNSYIRRENALEPLAAAFCNGTTVTCDGLSQWGSEELAQNGLGAYDILTYYYGNNIELVQNVPIENIEESYPGTPLRRGSTGEDVYTIQFELNNISVNYPLIPKIYPLNSVFDENTENAVKTFQDIFGLTVDGIVGRQTWYKLVYLYTGLRKLSELNSLGVDLDTASFISASSNDLKEGSSGKEVYYLQYMLSVVSQVYINIPQLDVTGFYDTKTKNAVLELQKYYSLPETGIADEKTFDAVHSAFVTTARYLDSLGYTFEDFSGLSPVPISEIQKNLNKISMINKNIQPVAVTDYIGPRTRDGIAKINRAYRINSSSLISSETIKRIKENADIFTNSINPKFIQYPGYVLKYGMRDSELQKNSRTLSTPIKNAQTMLREISFSYPEITRLIPTASFGNRTKTAVMEFQKFTDLPQNGEIDFAVWNTIYVYYKKSLSNRLSPDRVSPFERQNLPFLASLSGDSFAFVTIMLNKIKKLVPDIKIQEISYFDTEASKDNIKIIQKILKTDVTGILTTETWNGIINIYEALINGKI